MRVFVDEAGRWPLAWPLFVGVVLEMWDFEFEQIDEHFQDSKALSAKKREGSYDLLQEMKKAGLHMASGRASAEEIDRFGVTRAINLAIIRGLYQIFCSFWLKKKRNQTFAQVCGQISDFMHSEGISLLIDGKMDFGLRADLKVAVETLVKWDSKVRGIAMASILAKIERDRQMTELSLVHKHWGFEKHKGYGTKAHYAAIAKFGICEQHRKLFLKELFPDWQFELFDYENTFTEKPLI